MVVRSRRVNNGGTDIGGAGATSVGGRESKSAKTTGKVKCVVCVQVIVDGKDQALLC